jgi:hypothetical protein
MKELIINGFIVISCNKPHIQQLLLLLVTLQVARVNQPQSPMHHDGWMDG